MKACRKVLFFLDDWMFRIANWVVCLATIVLIVSVTIQVAFRYLLNNSPRWSTELCQLMLVWVVFWGAAIALRNGMHVQLDISRLHFPRWLELVFRFLSHLSVYVFIVVVFYYGSVLVKENIRSLSEAIKISYAFWYINLPLSSVLMAVGYTARLMGKEVKEL